MWLSHELELRKREEKHSYKKKYLMEYFQAEELSESGGAAGFRWFGLILKYLSVRENII